MLNVDYETSPDGTAVKLLTERAIQRGVGSKPSIGWRLAFKTWDDTADFVRRGEVEVLFFPAKSSSRARRRTP